MDENETHPIPCPESSTTPPHMYMPSVKTKPPFCSINDHFFQNKSFFFYKSKSIGRFPISTCISQVPCVYAFVGHRFPGLHRRTPRTFTTFLTPPVIMSNLNTRSFTGGVSTNLLCPTHIFFIFKTVRLILVVVPCYRAHHRTPNTVSISTMHSHPCHVMS